MEKSQTLAIITNDIFLYKIVQNCGKLSSWRKMRDVCVLKLLCFSDFYFSTGIWGKLFSFYCKISSQYALSVGLRLWKTFRKKCIKSGTLKNTSRVFDKKTRNFSFLFCIANIIYWQKFFFIFFNAKLDNLRSGNRP